MIDLATYGQVQAKLIENTQPRKRYQRQEHKFNKLLKCSCGRTKWSKHRSTHRVYACPRGKIGGCSGGEFREHLIITAVLEAVKNNLIGADAENRIRKILQEQNSVHSEDLLRLHDLENKYRVASERLLDLESLLPDGFREQMRTLKVEIDTLKGRVSSCKQAGSNAADEAKTLAESYSELLSGKSDEELLQRELLEQYITEIKLQYVFQRSGQKIYSAIDAVTILCSIGKRSRGETTAYRSSLPDSTNPLKIRTKVPLPPHFEPSRPTSYSPMI